MKSTILNTVIGALLLSGCQLSNAAEPAVLVTVSEPVKQQLSDFISRIVGGTRVILADNVLTEQPELFIEQRMPVDAQGRPLDGRHSLPSYRFILVKVKDNCILQHPASGQSITLQGATCRASAVTS